MKLRDILPDTWEQVAGSRSDGFKDAALRNLWDSDYMANMCLDCPLCRPIVRGGLLYIGCVFLDKCIKQYPVYRDNKEFK